MPEKMDYQTAALDGLKAEIHEFVQSCLQGYLLELSQHPFSDAFKSGGKVLRDAVWGDVFLNAAEVIILDSPIIQRLRRIGNLGLALLIFPGATHSRFEHTLGVTHVAGRIAKTVEKRLTPKIPEIPISPAQLVRLTALFHDTGHVFYSHAGEKYFGGRMYSQSERIKAAINAFERLHDNRRIALGEMLSALIVTSEPVIDLLAIALSYLPDNTGVDRETLRRLAEYIAQLILGYSSVPGLEAFSTIISGPIDADKCDYLARDALQTGVRVAVDLDRLAAKLAPIAMPSMMAGCSETSRFILGIQASAVGNVEELVVSRRLMYEKVYYHPKVRIAEAMLMEGIRLLDRGIPDLFKRFDHVLRLNDFDLVHWEAAQNLMNWAHRLGADVKDVTAFNAAAGLMEALASRRLYYRVAAIPQIPDVLNAKRSLSEVLGDIDVRTGLSVLEQEMQIISRLLKLDIKKPTALVANGSTLTQLVPDLMIDDPVTPRRCADLTVFDTPIECVYDDLLIAPWDSTIIAFLAAEAIIWRMFGFRLDKGCLHHKISSEKLNECRQQLLAAGYYAAMPALAALPSELYLRIRGLAERLQRVLYPISRDPVLTLETFLAQFDAYRQGEERTAVFDALLTVLEQLPLSLPTDTVLAWQRLRRRLPLDVRMAVSECVYLGNGFSSVYPCSVMWHQLPEVLDISVEALIVLDDGTTSDESLIRYFECLIAARDEKGQGALSDVQIEQLLQMRIFILSVGRYRQVEDITQQLNHLGLYATLLTDEDNGFSQLSSLTKAQFSILNSLCRRAAEDVLPAVHRCADSQKYEQLETLLWQLLWYSHVDMGIQQKKTWTALLKTNGLVPMAGDD